MSKPLVCVAVWRPISQCWEAAYLGSSSREAFLVMDCLSKYAFGAFYVVFGLNGTEVEAQAELAAIPPVGGVDCFNRFYELLQAVAERNGFDGECSGAPSDDGADDSEPSFH